MIPYKTLAVIGIIVVIIIAIYPSILPEETEITDTDRIPEFIELTIFGDVKATVTWTTLSWGQPVIKFNIPGDYIVKWGVWGSDHETEKALYHEPDYINVPLANYKYTFPRSEGIGANFFPTGDYVSIENIGTGVIEVHEVRIR